LAERLAADLGEEALPYHAGLGGERRAEAQRRFMAGDVRLVVATNAFGMGVDKADVRTVVHETVPVSLEAFYQEAGRAGRDGAPAHCLLFAEPRDKGLHVFFIQQGRVEEEDCARVAARLGAAEGEGRYDASLSDLAGGEDKARAVIGVLARAGVVRPAPASPDRAVGRIAAPYDGRARAVCRSLAGEAERVRWRQFRAVWRFVEERGCRRETILRHFGDQNVPAPVVPCCDVCAPEAAPAAPEPIRRAAANGAPPGDLDEAILDVVAAAVPAVGRTRTVEILRGGRSKVIAQHSYDGLPAYGSFAHLRGGDVLERVDGLLATGRLRSTGGRFPKLELAAKGRAA
jgi:ATP-dependent DNA helicase RecQ